MVELSSSNNANSKQTFVMITKMINDKFLVAIKVFFVCERFAEWDADVHEPLWKEILGEKVGKSLCMTHVCI